MIDNHAQCCFEQFENGARVFARYRRDPMMLVLLHVEAGPVLRGTGAADRLMREIVQQARDDRTPILPLCGYAAAWLRRHAPDVIV